MSEINHIDYVGFTFNGIHSSELGIKRTSDGSRFNENLLPTIQDKTVQVPGGDGMYHFGSYYTQRQFNISYAFDALTEEQLARIKEVFGDKKIHELIFDESPYKAYKAKVTGSAQIKHIPFAEGATNRVYKGEGSIQFAAYDPYAYSIRKFLNDEYYESFDNISEWNDAAKLLDEQGVFDIARSNPLFAETFYDEKKLAAWSNSNQGNMQVKNGKLEVTSKYGSFQSKIAHGTYSGPISYEFNVKVNYGDYVDGDISLIIIKDINGNSRFYLKLDETTKTFVVQDKNHTSFDLNIPCKENTTYRIRIKCNPANNSYMLYIDDIEVISGNMKTGINNFGYIAIDINTFSRIGQLKLTYDDFLISIDDNSDNGLNNIIKLYNPGVKESDFILAFDFKDKTSIPAGRIYIDDNYLKFNELKKQGEDDQVKFNSKLNLIEGYKNGYKTGNLYNKHITGGTFFKIPLCNNPYSSKVLVMDKVNGLHEYFNSIEYNYIYL